MMNRSEPFLFDCKFYFDIMIHPDILRLSSFYFMSCPDVTCPSTIILIFKICPSFNYDFIAAYS